MAEKYLKNKAKKLLTGALIKYVLPLFLAFIIIAAAAGAVVEIPNMLAEKISEYFSKLFGGSDNSDQLEDYTLSQLLTFFETNPDLDGLEEMISPELLANYVKMQMNSGFRNRTEIIQSTNYRNNNIVSTENRPILLEYEGISEKYTTPWQMLAAVDIANGNFGSDEPSEEAKDFYDATTPLFDGVSAVQYKPSVFETITTTTTYKLKTWTNSVIITADSSPTSASAPAPSQTSSVKTWTETTVVKIPKPIFKTISSYSGTVTNHISYKTSNEVGTRVTDKYTENGTEKNLSYVTTVTTETPILESSDFVPSFARAMNAINISVPEDNIDLFMEALSKFPNAAEYQMFFITSSMSGIFGGSATSDGVYNFQFPSLDYDSLGSQSRGDILNVAKSVIGLDYFWGGKYQKKGFNPNWGKLTTMGAGGHPASGTTQRLGLDCTGFVGWTYTSAGLPLSGSSIEMLSNNEIIEISESELEPGDIGLYHNYTGNHGGQHAGIYIGEQDGAKWFIHSGGYAWKDADHPLGQVAISALNRNYDGNPMVKFKRFYRYANKSLN